MPWYEIPAVVDCFNAAPRNTNNARTVHKPCGGLDTTARMCFRSLRHRNTTVLVVLFCIIMLLVPSYLYRDRYMGHPLKEAPPMEQETLQPSSSLNTGTETTEASSTYSTPSTTRTQTPELPQATESIALHNNFPSPEARLHTGVSQVFQPSGVTPRFSEEVLDSIANRTFLLLKTGSETMWSRMPVHLQTTMRRFPHNAIYSDIAAPMMGVNVIDALMHLPTSALNSQGLFGYRVRRQNIYEHWAWGPRRLNIEGAGGGWDLDKYKNVPAFADAWAKSSNSDWFMMLDDDAYMLTLTLADLVHDKDPDKPWYLGKGVGLNPMFAHGGSGIILSRGAMRAIFGEPTDYARHAEVIAVSAERAHGDCCGDSVVSKIYTQYTGVPAERDLELTEANQTFEHGIFQGNTLTTTRVNYDTWCSPVGVFHHVSPWEIEELFAWERVVAERKLAQDGAYSAVSYAEFYRDFVLPYVAPQRDHWHFSLPTADYEGVVYKAGEENDEVMDGDRALDPVLLLSDCRRACELDNGCLSWHWQENVLCQLFRYDVGRGEGLNAWSVNWKPEMSKVSAGFMSDRIRQVRAAASCDPLVKNEAGVYNDNATTSEGWYLRALEEERGVSAEWGIHPLAQEPLTSTIQLEGAAEI